MSLPSLHCLGHESVATGTLFNFPPSGACPICLQPLFGCEEAADGDDSDDWTKCEPDKWSMVKDGPDVRRVIALRCGHMFHVDCMRRHIEQRINHQPNPLAPNCPSCRAERESLSNEVLEDLGLDPATHRPLALTPAPSSPPPRSRVQALRESSPESPPAAPARNNRSRRMRQMMGMSGGTPPSTLVGPRGNAPRARNLFSEPEPEPEPEPFPVVPAEPPGSPNVPIANLPPPWFIDLLLMESVEAYQAMHAAFREEENVDRLASASESNQAQYRTLLAARQERRQELQQQAVGPVARDHRRRIREAYTELSPRGESVPPFTDAQGESMLRWMRDQLDALRRHVIEDMEGGRARYESLLQLFQRLLDRARRVQRIFVNDTFPGLHSSVVARLREGRDLARAYFLRGLRFYLGTRGEGVYMRETMAAILLAVSRPPADDSRDAFHWAHDLHTATNYLNLTNYDDDADDEPVPEPIPPLEPSDPNQQYVGIEHPSRLLPPGPVVSPPPSIEDAQRIRSLEEQLADANRRLEEAQRRTAQGQEATARRGNAVQNFARMQQQADTSIADLMQSLQVDDENNDGDGDDV